MKRPSIAIVGSGRAGTAMAQCLADAGFEVREIVCRTNSRSVARAQQLARKVKAAAHTSQYATLNAEVVWFFVPDAKIERAALELATRNWRGKIALHASGVLSSDVLGELRSRGASVASMHPLMTFVPGSLPGLAGATFALEGDHAALRAAMGIVRALKGDVLRIRKQNKIAYHAFATMICPLLVSLLAASEQVGRLAGLSGPEARLRMMPIIRQTLRNVEKTGPAGSFSGPIVRGDVETVRQHLSSLSRLPRAKHAYISLALAALNYLPNRHRREMEELLQEHSVSFSAPSGSLRSRPLTAKNAKNSRKVR